MADGESIRDSIEAAVKSLDAPIEAAPVIETPQAAPEAATPEAPQALTAETTAGQNRDEHGRFKPKTIEPEPGAQVATAEPEPKPESAKPENEGPQAEATRIPPSLSAAVKAQWNDLPPEVRKDISRLEETVQTAKAEWGRKGERLNRYDEILGPHLDKLHLSGLDEFSGIQTLFAAHNLLERNPVEGLIQVARSYNVHPQQIVQAMGLPQNGAQPGAEGQQAPTVAPNLDAALQPFLARVQTLEQRLQQESQRTEAEKFASAQAEVAQFASRPENLYFENVKGDVAKRLETGTASTLAEAYEQAIWASKEIRPLLIKQQSAEAAKPSAEDAARLKAQAARQASGSVTGAPSPGASAPRPSSHGSIRADLEAAANAVSSAA